MLSGLRWKDEPVSPLSNEEVSLVDDTFYQNSLDDEKFEDDLDVCESKAEVASQILENLENLVDLDELIKAEPSFLLDEKMLPLLDEVEPPRGAVAVPVPLKNEYYKSLEENTAYLFNEFEKVYYELNHGALTPPQSPPCEQPVITTLEPLLDSDTPYHSLPVKDDIYSVPEKQLVFSCAPVVNNYAPISLPQPDIARELAVVDELVRTRVKDMQWSSGPSSPESSFGDSSSSDDPEWVPEPIENYNASFNPLIKTPRKRNKPYSTPDDKKSRKKEQNKNAATRYRQKKKAEVEVILSEEKGLLDKRDELNNQICDLAREIKYLKGLMRDLFKAKGLIN